MNDVSVTSVSAPASLILLGQYSAAFGGPGLAMAVERRIFCTSRPSNKFQVNGEELDQDRHPLIRGALLQGWTDMDKPISFVTESDIPEDWGWGISAVSVACLGAISMFHDHIILEEVARRSFETELEVVKGANPLDAVTSTYGSVIFMDSHENQDSLWKFARDGSEWYTHMRDSPETFIVLGDTGIPSSAVQMNGKVRRFYDGNAFARDIVQDLGQLVYDGEEALSKGDTEGLGRTMEKCHKLLVTLGASHPKLDKLCKAVGRFSYGSKAVGAGGGGCIVSLTDRPDETIEAINKVGGQGFLVSPAAEGLRLEPEPQNDEKGSGDEPDPQ